VTTVEFAPEGSVGAPGPAPLTEPQFTEVRERLEAGVVDAAGGQVGDAPLVVGLPLLRRARYLPDALGRPDEPFAWKPAFVRRSLGIAAVRACADRRFRSPADAVRPLAEQAVAEWRLSGWRTFHWEPWFAGLGAGGRAAVLAVAVTWATPLWAAFDWPRIGPRAELGRPDDRWSVPGVPAVELRGRTEARLTAPDQDDPGHSGRTLVSVSSGCPGEGWRDELAFLALVGGLGVSGPSVPTRVVGLWPESGARMAVEIDAGALVGAVDRVVDTVAVAVEVTGHDRAPVTS
jgi:hypothetical protein